MPKNCSRILILILYSALSLSATGCMTMRVVAKYDSDNPVPKKATRWVYAWGLVQPNDIKTDASCESICKVTAKNNFGGILVSFISLGIAVPLTVEYECCPHEPPPGEL